MIKTLLDMLKYYLNSLNLLGLKCLDINYFICLNLVKNRKICEIDEYDEKSCLMR